VLLFLCCMMCMGSALLKYTARPMRIMVVSELNGVL